MKKRPIQPAQESLRRAILDAELGQELAHVTAGCCCCCCCCCGGGDAPDQPIDDGGGGGGGGACSGGCTIACQMGNMAGY